MTRIDPHAAHPSLARQTEKPNVHCDGGGADFFEHLHTDGSAAHRHGDRPAAGLSRPDLGSPREDKPARDLMAIQPQADGQSGVAIPAGEDAAVAPARLHAGDNTALPTAGRAPITVSGTITGLGTVAEAAARARVFEQHWFANGYLSVIADGNEGSASPGNGRGAGMPGGHSPVVAAPDAVLQPPVMPAEALRREATAVWPVVVEGPGSDPLTPQHSIERLVRGLGPLIAADQPWPERLLRLSQRAGGKVALWIRDYTLPQAAIAPLIAHLRQLARKEGIALERVVVNGTSVWQSDSVTGEV